MNFYEGLTDAVEDKLKLIAQKWAFAGQGKTLEVNVNSKVQM